MAQTSKPHIEGVRVIRGPDWTAADIDGGEGHVGTVTSLLGSGMAHVIWDVGEEMDCRAGLDGKFDLRVFDSGTVDVHHEAQCQSCQEDVYGALWRCQTCPACSLCSRCYADDKHETGHQFLRFDLPTSTGKLMKKRKISVKIRAVGLFPGATVVRGNHWMWGKQDGGPESEGEIMDYVESPDKKGRRNLVTVEWPSGKKNVYRLGFKGLMDIKCLEEEVGGFYYREHLPVLDTDDFSSLSLDPLGAKTDDPVPANLTFSSGEKLPSEDDHEPQAAHPNVDETALAPARADDLSSVENDVVKARDHRELQESASGEEKGTSQSVRIEIPPAVCDDSSEETVSSTVNDVITLEQSEEGKELGADRGEKSDKETEEQEKDSLATTLQTSETSDVPHQISDASDVSTPVSGLSDTSLQTADVSGVPSSAPDRTLDAAGAAGNEGQGLTAGFAEEEETARTGNATVDTLEAAPDTSAAGENHVEIVNVADTGGGSPRKEAEVGGWRIGDRAAIAVPREELKELQHGFGGVTYTMLKKIGRMGVVTRVGPGPNTVGLRLGRSVFRVNTTVLQRVHTFAVGDTVRILDDLFKLNILSERVGWRSSMDDTAGKVGEITKIDEDGDLRVQFADKRYAYSPACCVPAPGETVDAVGDSTGGLGDNLGTLLSGDAGNLRERLAGLLGATGGTGGGGAGHRLRMRDLLGLGSLNQQFLEHLQGLQSAVGLSGLVDLEDDSSEEGELRKAIVVGDLEKVYELCLAKPSLVDSSHNELTPLMIASHKGKRKIVDVLLNMGANVNARGLKDNTPLCFALDEKEEEVALLLIERGADVTVKSGKGRTPLHMAAFNSCNEAAQLIIHMGADVNAQDKYGDTPLHDAIARENVGMVELLTQLEQVNMRLTNKRGYSPLAWACRVKNAEIINLILIRDSSNVNTLKNGDHAPIHIAALGKFFLGVHLLVTVGNADVNLKTGDNGLTVLHAACLVADLEAVESILNLGADINAQDKDGETPLHLAMGGNDGRSEKSMFEMEKDVQSRLKIALLLISKGAFVDAVNRKGRPPTTYGLMEVQKGVRDFIEQNPGLIARKTASNPTGAVSASIMTSLRDVSMPCRLCQRPSDVTLVPCGHRTVCRACAVSVKNCPLCSAFVHREETIKGTLLPPKVNGKKTDQNVVQSKPIMNEHAFTSEAPALKLVLNSGANGQTGSADETIETVLSDGNMEQKSGFVSDTSSNASFLLAGGSSQESVHMRQERICDQNQAFMITPSTNIDIPKVESNVGREATTAPLCDVEQTEKKVEEKNTPPETSLGLLPIAEYPSGYKTFNRDKEMAADGQATDKSHLTSESVDAKSLQPTVLNFVPDINSLSVSNQCVTTIEQEAVLSAQNPPNSVWTFNKTQGAEDSETISGMQRRDVVFSFGESESKVTGLEYSRRPGIFSPVDEESVPWSLPRRQNPPARINDNKSFDRQTAIPAPSLSEGVPSQPLTKTKNTSFQFSVDKELELPELPDISLVSMWGQDSLSFSTDLPKAPDSAWKPQYSVSNSATRKPQTEHLGERKDQEEVGESSSSSPNKPGLVGGAMNMETSRITSRRYLSPMFRSDNKGLVPMNTNLGNTNSVRLINEESAILTEELVRRDLGLPPRLPSQGISQTSPVSTPCFPMVTMGKHATAVLKPNEKGGTSTLEQGLARNSTISGTQSTFNDRSLNFASISLQSSDKAKINDQTVDERVGPASAFAVSHQSKNNGNDTVENKLSSDNKTWSAGLSLIQENAPEPKKSASPFTHVDKMLSWPDLALSLPPKLEPWQWECQKGVDAECTRSTNMNPKKTTFAAQVGVIAPDDGRHGVDVRLSLPLRLHDSPRREKEDRKQTAVTKAIRLNNRKSGTLNDPAIASVSLRSPIQYDIRWDFSKEVDENEHADKITEDSINTLASYNNNKSSASMKSEDYSTTVHTTQNSHLTKEVTVGFVKNKDDAFYESDEKALDADPHAQSDHGHQKSTHKVKESSDESHLVNTQKDSKTANPTSSVINSEKTENQLNCVFNKSEATEEQIQGSRQIPTFTNKIKESSATGISTPAEKQKQSSVNAIGGQNETTVWSAFSMPTVGNKKHSSANIDAVTSEDKEKVTKEKVDIPKTFIHIDNMAAIFSSMGAKANAVQQAALEADPDNLAKKPMMSTTTSGRQRGNSDTVEAFSVTRGTTQDVLLLRDLTPSSHDKEKETILMSPDKCGPLNPTAELVEPGHKHILQVGHRVVIKVNEDSFKKLQTNFGGATENMLQCIGNIGIVTAVDKDGSVRVQFRSLSYRFNPQALLHIPDLQVGDVVRIHDDLDLVQRLNRHVGFGPEMVQTLGKAGRVIKIENNGDVKITFGNHSFLYSPACCVPSQGATIDTLTITTGGETGRAVPESSSSSSDSPSGIDLEGLEKVKMLAKMVKEDGSSMSMILNLAENESSAISRLFDAIEESDSGLVTALCQSDPFLINREHKGRRLTPLMFAGWKGLENMVNLLLDLGADVNHSLTESPHAYDSCCPLLASLESRREDAAILLLQRGANPNCRSYRDLETPMHYAAQRDLLQVLQLLVLQGADVNAQDKDGDTPLIVALLTGHTRSAEVILGDPRVDLTLANRKGVSPLHAACLRSYPSIVQEILLRDTSQVNVVMNGEYTPLHLAANDDCLENIKLLVLVGGADVNCVAGGRKHRGTRPLHMACLNGNYSCVEALLDFGATVNVEDTDGDTPLHFAIGGKVPSEGGEETRMMFIEARVRIACMLISNGAFVDAENHKGRTCMRYGETGVQAAVQDFMDRNRHLVIKKGKFGGDAQRPYRAQPGPCAVCKIRNSVVTLLPCGHKVICSECCVSLAQCPQCQRAVLDSTTDDAKGGLFEPI